MIQFCILDQTRRFGRNLAYATRAAISPRNDLRGTRSWGLAILVVAMLVVEVPEIANGQESIQETVLKRQLKLIDTTPLNEPVIMRLDLELEQLTRQANTLAPSQRVSWLALAMSPQGRLYQRFGMGDLNGFAKLMLGQAQYPHVKLHLDSYRGRNLTAEIQAAYKKVAQGFGRPLAKAPIYKVAFGYQKQTNAAIEGRDRRTGRHVIILNRSALAEGDDWEAAIIHETWHAFQRQPGKSLRDRCVHEGMATYLTKLSDPKLADHKVMLWDKAKWASAEKHRREILRVFTSLQNSSEPKHVNAFTKLNMRIPSLPNAPDRSGYYIGLLACRAWHRARPKAKPADLIAAKPDEIFNSLLAN